MERFTSHAREALNLAIEASQELEHSHVGSEHILLGLIRRHGCLASTILYSHNATNERVLQLIDQLISTGDSIMLADKHDYTPMARRIIENSYKEAVRYKAQLIGTEHLLIAIIKETNSVACKLLHTMNINVQKMYNDILGAMGEDVKNLSDDGYASVPAQNTPILDKYSRDLTKLAMQGKLDPVIGRDTELQRVMQILSRRTKNNPCLIGESGVGKTAVVEGLAQMIAIGDVPETLLHKRVVTLDISGMVAGSKYRGEFEERIKRTISEVVNAGNILLFIDELHTIIGAGGAEGSLDASNILKPSLARGELQVVGATTIDEYRKYVEKDAALERRFQPVTVDEPSEEDTYRILAGLRPKYESYHNVTITDDALRAAVKLSTRYINDRFLPDKAIDLVDEAASRTRIDGFRQPDSIKQLSEEVGALEKEKEAAIKKEDFETAAQIKKQQGEIKEHIEEVTAAWKEERRTKTIIVDETKVADVVSTWTKIPVQRLTEEENEKLRHLEDTLHKRVIGQGEAVTAVAKAIRRGRVGLKDTKRPIGSFLFLGPTGVGKTELSKALAEAMFGTDDALIRVDMSEYMDKESVSKIVGSPPGYVGYEEGGQLAEKVRRNPYSVVLLDEIEKAHPDVFNVFLQVLDDGHITDSQGRKVDFKNTIIIMTSNAGAERIVAPKLLGFASSSDAATDYKNMKEGVMDEVRRLFKPEFLNRIDEIQVFHQLTREDMDAITDILIAQINSRLAEERSIKLNISEEAKSFLVDKGYDPKYGARPLKRVLQNEIEDHMAEDLLDGKIKDGDHIDVHSVESEGEKMLVFQ